MAAPGKGSSSYVRYGYESVFGTTPGDSSLTTYFGHNVKFTASPTNNIERIPNLNDRNYSKFAAKKFEGSFTVDFQASNFYALKGVLGSVSTDGGGPYNHKYSESATPSGATIQSSEDLGTDSERTFVGCVFNNYTLNANVGEVVTGRIDGIYRSESKDSTLNTNGNSTDSEDVFTFSHGTFEFPNSTTLAEVQSVELSVNNNAENLWGLGSRFATNIVHKQRVYEVRVGKIREVDTDLLDDFYGSSTTITNPGTPSNVATLKLTLSNGSTGTDLRRLVFELGNLQVAEYNSPLEPIEAIKENGTLYALNLGTASGAVYTNNTASHV